MDLPARQLLAFVRSKGGAVSIGQGNSAAIAQVIGVPSGELADVAHRLEVDGLLTLERTTAESFFVEVTPRGEAFLDQAPPPPAKRSAVGGPRRLWLLLVLVALLSLLTGLVIGYMLGVSSSNPAPTTANEPKPAAI